jgi:hypothetical protein
MFTDNTISKRVMAAIKQRIAAKQRAYDEGVKTIDTHADAELKKVEAKRIEDKAVLADKLVSEILG